MKYFKYWKENWGFVTIALLILVGLLLIGTIRKSQDWIAFFIAGGCYLFLIGLTFVGAAIQHKDLKDKDVLDD